jgi:mannosylglycoprotein endo-beta-mannosidase
MKYFFVIILSFCFYNVGIAQDCNVLNTGWLCKRADSINSAGVALSLSSGPTANWMRATVPGTVLTTLLDNKKFPDPFYGMNNEQIPDIFLTGRPYYTYWFIKDFHEPFPEQGGLVWLNFRGINYSADIFLNGHKLTNVPAKGMFLRHEYNITSYLNRDGKNRLAVIVYPPDPVGNPNGGQGGDGEIARNVTHQYVAGWDWIQPVRDRNTGIWDQVTIKRSKWINLKNPRITTKVPGIRNPGDSLQAPATLEISAELENPGYMPVKGVLEFIIDKIKQTKEVYLPAHSTNYVIMPLLKMADPKLWWPNGCGEPFLYPVAIIFKSSSGLVLDENRLKIGIRELRSNWNDHTKSMEISVNGRKIFIKGGNWIISDELLRFSKMRYEAEVRFHRDMNLNLIRVWGGALTERPEFYDACDKYGLLVWQDFWNSGDCNGRWTDPKKKENQWVRRTYPDDHSLFLTCASDQVKMIRNHPSLAIWCGGNEITPSKDILHLLKDSIIPKLDGTRPFIDFSNSDSLSYNSIGGNGDGPYGIQNLSTFFGERTFPFNSEVGSVGVGDYTSLARFLPEANLETFPKDQKQDSVWQYHKYISYEKFIMPYGEPTNTRDFTEKAQLVNYDQYRGLAEGFTSHMWDWYTGFVIWKTQNPWTALRGQMYDYYLDPNACLYGLKKGGTPLHVMFNPTDSSIEIANNGFKTVRDLMLEVKLFDMQGGGKIITMVFNEIGPTAYRKYFSIGDDLKKSCAAEGAFLSLRLLNTLKEIVDENIYWLKDSAGVYSGIKKYKAPVLKIDAVKVSNRIVKINMANPAGGPVAFFNRISLISAKTKKRLLPVFYSDNYITIPPGELRTVEIDFSSINSPDPKWITVEGWHAKEIVVPLTE